MSALKPGEQLLAVLFAGQLLLACLDLEKIYQEQVGLSQLPLVPVWKQASGEEKQLKKTGRHHP